jgi:hypothetical protein
MLLITLLDLEIQHYDLIIISLHECQAYNSCMASKRDIIWLWF